MRVLLLALLAATVSGQTFERISEGPFAGLPHGMSVGPGSVGTVGPLDPTENLYKVPGVVSTDPVGWPLEPTRPELPDFSVGAIFAGVSPRPVIDAMSIGLDWILSDGSGHVSVPPGQWGAITFSVTRSAVGRPPTIGQTWGRIWEEARAIDGAAADLFSYILPFSSGIPADWIDRTMRAQDSSELGVWRPTPPTRGDLDGHDVFMGLYRLDPTWVSTFLPARPWFYFSVTPATVGNVPSTWWSPAQASAATILRCRWDPTTRLWGSYEVFRSYSDLGLSMGDDIDALGVDEPQQFVMLSTQLVAGRDQLLFVNLLAATAAAVTYRMPNDEPVSMRLGLLGTDDMDAICLLDPGGSPRGLTTLGKPVPSPLLGAFVHRIASSSFRTWQNGLFIEHWLLGWPPNGRPQPSDPPGVAYLLITPGRQLQTAISIGPIQRQPNAPLGGAPVRFRWRVPNQTVLYGADIDAHWAVIDGRITSFDLGHPTRLRL